MLAGLLLMVACSSAPPPKVRGCHDPPRGGEEICIRRGWNFGQYASEVIADDGIDGQDGEQEEEAGHSSILSSSSASPQETTMTTASRMAKAAT